MYHDGSVLVHHSGVEMGQGLTTKVKQVENWIWGEVENCICGGCIDVGDELV